LQGLFYGQTVNISSGFQERPGAGLLAPHRVILIEHVIDPMDNGIRQIIVVPGLITIDIDGETVDRHISVVCHTAATY
jgi:hypothetical protein